MNDRQILRIIGKNVRVARLKADMTQECLAEIAEVHLQTISNIERGKFPVLVTTFARISQALEIASDRLLEGLPELSAWRVKRIKKALMRKRKPPKR